MLESVLSEPIDASGAIDVSQPVEQSSPFLDFADDVRKGFKKVASFLFAPVQGARQLQEALFGNNLGNVIAGNTGSSSPDVFQPDTSSGSARGDMTWFKDWLMNSFDSEKDWQRQLDLMEREQSYSASQAELSRQWQKEMSDTAIQRAVNDAKKAGLNPYTVLHSASSASTPVGATASSGTRSAVQSAPNSARILSQFLGSLSQLLSRK